MKNCISIKSINIEAITKLSVSEMNSISGGAKNIEDGIIDRRS